MRRKMFLATRQHTLPFARHEIWWSIPSEQQQQCRELLEQLLRAVMHDEEQRLPEEEP